MTGVERLKSILAGKTGKDGRIPFGLADDGRMYEPLDVPLGKACGCVCPACRAPIIAKHCLASDRQAHFAHSGGANCSSGFETALHLAAKQLIAERAQLHFPALSVDVYQVDAIGVEHRAAAEMAPAGIRPLSAVVLEQWMVNIRPDVIVDSDELGRVLIEIAVTHFVDREKLDKIEQLGLAVLEIDLSNLREASFDSIAVYLFETPAHSKWLHHPRMASARAQLVAELAEKFAHAARLAAENHELWEGQRAHAQRAMDERMKQHALRLEEQKILAEQASLARRQQHHADMRRAAIFKGKSEPEKLAAITAWMGSDRLPPVLSVHVRGSRSFGVNSAHIWQTALFGSLVHKRLPAQTILRKDVAVTWLHTRFESTPQFKDSAEIAVWDYLTGLAKRGALFQQRGGAFRIGVVDLQSFETINAISTGQVLDPDVLEWAADETWPSKKQNEQIAQAMLGRDDLTYLWGKMVDVDPWIRRMTPSRACSDASQYDIGPGEALAFLVRAGMLRLRQD